MKDEQLPSTASKEDTPNAVEKRIALLQPIGEVFVNGLASSYDDEYPEDLDPNCHFSKYMSKKEFLQAINKINDALLDHWPCMPCTAFAFGCCLCSLGSSFYCATTQVREAEARANLQIRRINNQTNFATRNVQWRLVRTWYKRESYVEIVVVSNANNDANGSRTVSQLTEMTDTVMEEDQQAEELATVADEVMDRAVAVDVDEISEPPSSVDSMDMVKSSSSDSTQWDYPSSTSSMDNVKSGGSDASLWTYPNSSGSMSNVKSGNSSDGWV